MYTPRFNEVSDREVLFEAMRAYSFAILFGPLDGTIGAVPHRATHLPLVVRDEGPHGVVEGHFAKANPHWQALANREILVVFPGPHSYVSPSLYVEQTSVPTWNYIAIHAHGTLHLVEEETAKETLLFNLIEANEPAYADRWRGMPEDYRHRLLNSIVGFRIPISRIEGKFKLSQNRSEADRRGVEAAHKSGNDDQRALADWMKRLIG